MKTLQIMLRHRVAPIKARSASRPMSSWVTSSEYDRSPYEVLAEKWRTFDKTMADARSQKEGPLRWTPPTYKNENFLELQKHQSSNRNFKRQTKKTEPLVAQKPPPLPHITNFEEPAASLNDKMSIDSQAKSTYQGHQESHEFSDDMQQLTLNANEIPKRKSVMEFQENISLEDPKIEDFSSEKTERKKITKDARGRKVSFVEEPTTILFSKDAPKEGWTTKEFNSGNFEFSRDSQMGESVPLEGVVESSQNEMPYHTSNKPVKIDEDSVNVQESSRKGSTETVSVKSPSRLVRSKSSTSKHESKRTVSTKTIKKHPEDFSYGMPTLEKELLKRTEYESQSIKPAFMNLKKSKTKTTMLKSIVNKNTVEDEPRYQIQESQSISGSPDTEDFKASSPHRQKLSKETFEALNKHAIRKDRNLNNFHSSTEMLRKANKLIKGSKNEKPVKSRYLNENLSSSNVESKKKLDKAIKRTDKELGIEQGESSRSNNENQAENDDSISEVTQKNKSTKKIDQRAIETDQTFETNDSSNLDHVTSTNEINKPDISNKVKKTVVKKAGISRLNRNYIQKSSGQSGKVSSFAENSSSQMINEFKDRSPSPSVDLTRNSIFNKKKYDDLRKYISEAEVELRVQKQRFNNQRHELKKRLRKLALNPLTEIERNYKNHFPQSSDYLNQKNKNKFIPKQNSKMINEGVTNPSVAPVDKDNQSVSNAWEDANLMAENQSSLKDLNTSERPQVESDYHTNDEKASEPIPEIDPKSEKLRSLDEDRTAHGMAESGGDVNSAVSQSDAKISNQNNRRKTSSNKKDNINEYSEDNPKQRSQIKHEVNKNKLLKNDELEYDPSNSKESDFSPPSENNLNHARKPFNKTKETLLFDYYKETPDSSNIQTKNEETESDNQNSMLRSNMTRNKTNIRKNDSIDSTEAVVSQKLNQNKADDDDLRISEITKAYNDLLQQSKVKAKKKPQNINLRSPINSQESMLNRSKMKFHQRFVDRNNLNKTIKNMTNRNSGSTNLVEDSSDSPASSYISTNPEQSLQDEIAEGRNNSNVPSFSEEINSSKQKDSAKLSTSQNKLKTNFKRIQPSITQPILNEFKKKYSQHSMSKRDYYIPPSRSLTESKYTASLPIINQLLYEENQKDTLKNNSTQSKQVDNQMFEFSQRKASFASDSIGFPIKKNLSGKLGHSKAYLPSPLSFSEIINKQKNKSQTFKVTTNPLDSQELKPSNKHLNDKTTTVGNFGNSPSQTENNDLYNSYIKKDPFITSGFNDKKKSVESLTPVHLSKENITPEKNYSPKKQLSEFDISRGNHHINETNFGMKIIDNLQFSEELPHLKVGEQTNIDKVYGNSIVQQFSPGFGSLSTFRDEDLRSSVRTNSPTGTLYQNKPLENNRQSSTSSFQNVFKNKIKKQCIQMDLQHQGPPQHRSPTKALDILNAVRSGGNDLLSSQTALKNNRIQIKLGENNNSTLPIPALSPMFEERPLKPINKPEIIGLKENNSADQDLISTFKNNDMSVKKSKFPTPKTSQIQLKSKSRHIPETIEFANGAMSHFKNIEKTGNENKIKENSPCDQFQMSGLKETINKNSKANSGSSHSHIVESAVQGKDNGLKASSEHLSRVRKPQHVVSLSNTSFNDVPPFYPVSQLRKRSNVFRRRKPIKAKKPNIPKPDPLLSSSAFNIKNLDSIFRIDESTHLPGLPIRKWKSPTQEKVTYVASIPSACEMP